MGGEWRLFSCFLRGLFLLIRFRSRIAAWVVGRLAKAHLATLLLQSTLQVIQPMLLHKLIGFRKLRTRSRSHLHCLMYNALCWEVQNGTPIHIRAALDSGKRAEESNAPGSWE